MIKIVVDGSIQGFSARLRAPGYYNGAPNGLWYIAPEQLREIFERALAAGVRVHSHTNGDEATELVLDTLTQALRKHPSPDHRFTLQHCQLANAAQFRRMNALGMCVNLFPNHHFYWGDQHYALTVGPERAERMNACATALANGVPMAIHSDAPVTPLGPLFTAWCAVNRKTASGRMLGTEERISVADALRTITLGAAYTLGLDSEIGSIEVRQARRLCRAGGRSDRDRRRQAEGRADLGHGARRPHLRRRGDMTARHPGHADRRLSRRRQDHAGQSSAAQRRWPPPRRAGQRVRRTADRCRPDRGARRQSDQHFRRLHLLQFWQRSGRGADAAEATARRHRPSADRDQRRGAAGVDRAIAVAAAGSRARRRDRAGGCGNHRGPRRRSLHGRHRAGAARARRHHCAEQDRSGVARTAWRDLALAWRDHAARSCRSLAKRRHPP